MVEDFEVCPPAFWTLGSQWQCGTPTAGPNGAFSGTSCLGTNLSGNYAVTSSWSAVEMPQVTLVGMNNPTLSFRAWVETENDYDGFNVKVSDDGGFTWTLAQSVSPSYTYLLDGDSQWGWSAQTALAGWREYSVDLSQWVGWTVALKFDFYSDVSTS